MSDYPRISDRCAICGKPYGWHAYSDHRCPGDDGDFRSTVFQPVTAQPAAPASAKPTESVDPAHYKGDIQCIDAIRSMLGHDGFIAYCRGTIAKYNWRLGRKDDPLVEIGKAQVYAQWIKDTLDGKPLTKGEK